MSSGSDGKFKQSKDSNRKGVAMSMKIEAGIVLYGREFPAQ